MSTLKTRRSNCEFSFPFSVGEGEQARLSNLGTGMQEYIWNEVFYGKNKDKWHALLARATDKYMREQVPPAP